MRVRPYGVALLALSLGGCSIEPFLRNFAPDTGAQVQRIDGVTQSTPLDGTTQTTPLVVGMVVGPEGKPVAGIEVVAYQGRQINA